MKIKAWFDSLVRSDNAPPTPPNTRPIVFFLMYKNDTIGTLNFTGAHWIFTYSDWFKQQSNVKPFANFPDIHREYISEDLPPFFESRIPGLSQPQVETFLQMLKTNNPVNEGETKVALLKEFGRRSITNPFELQPAV